MKKYLKTYEDSIPKKHSFAWTPKYGSSFTTDLNKTVFVPIVLKTFEELGWDVVYQDQTNAEAKRKRESAGWTEKITVSFDYDKVQVKSVSLGNEMWDNGKNSKNVQLFIHAFQTIEQEFDTAALWELEEQVNKENNWDDYIIPTSLPAPEKQTKPQLWMPVVGGIIMTVLLAYLIALLSVEFGYIIGIYEIVVGTIIGFGFKYLIKTSNYTKSMHLDYLLIGVIVLTYILNQYFLYGFIMDENSVETIGFLDFIQFRLEEGLVLESLNLGWIGLVLSWAFQGIITYYIAHLQMASHIAEHKLGKVPSEVIDFAFYHFVKGKNETEVRNELTAMGWTTIENQNDVFEAINAIREIQALDRID